MTNHDYTTRALVQLDSSSLVACFSFRAGSDGHLHCFVLEVSGSSITNAEVAVSNQGKEITQRMPNSYAHMGMDRASDSGTFVACFQVKSPSGLGCALFSVSGHAVSAVGAVMQSAMPGDNQNPAVAGLTSTTAVTCSAKSVYETETKCSLMTWTDGDLNSLVFATNFATVPVKSFFRTVSRLSDSRALLCYVNKNGASQYTQHFQECVMVEHTAGEELNMDHAQSIQFTQVGGGGEQGLAYMQRTIALGANKAVTTYESRRRQNNIYTLTMDIDEATGQVTQAGAEIMIGAQGQWGHPGALGSDRAYSVYLKQFLYVTPQW